MVVNNVNELTDKQKLMLALRLKNKNTASKQNNHSKIEKIDRADKVNFITSYNQKRFWFLDQWDINKAINNTYLVSKLVGSLNMDALQRTFDEIVKKHEVLRMVYQFIDGEIYCTPHPDPQCEIEHIIINNLTKDKADEKIQEVVQEGLNRPFDLAHQIPIRTILVDSEDNEYFLVVVFHHIAADMWSLRLITHEVSTIYNAFVNNVDYQPEELPIQYLDFAAWQRDQGEDGYDSGIEYWKNTLKGAPPLLDLPTDFPRPEVQTHEGDTYNFVVPSDLFKNIQIISNGESITPFVFTLSAYAILLSKYSGMNDIVIGSPAAGRTIKAVENLIGVFINVLSLRIDLTQNQSIRGLLQQIRKIVGGAMVYQDTPFERLIKELGIQQNSSYTRIFQTMLNFQPIKKQKYQMTGLESFAYDHADNNTVKFDLNLAIKYIEYDDVSQEFTRHEDIRKEEIEKEVIGQLYYDVNLFLPETIEQMTRHLLNILKQMTTNLDMPVKNIQILSDDEMEKLMGEWSHTTFHTYRNVSYFHKLFEEQVELNGSKAAVVFQGDSYSYNELNKRANQLARHLISVGVGPEKLVGLYVERNLDMVVGMLGILKAGGAYVPFDPIFPEERIKYIMEDANIDTMVTQHNLMNGLGFVQGVKMIPLDKEWDNISKYNHLNIETTLQPSNLMYVLYTSGSTGKPKGVAVEHGNYLNYYFGVMERLNLEPNLKYAIASTFAADLATINIWAALNTGGQIHILSQELSVNPQAFARYFVENQIDVIKMVPSHFKALHELTNLKDIIPNRCLILAGEASYWSMIDDIRQCKPETNIQIHYGPTETTVSMLTYSVTSERPVQHTSTLPLGRPLPNVLVYVLDEDRQAVPKGVAGELYIGGPGLARGYWNQPALTAEKFIMNPFDQQGNSRLYRTGDRVRFLKDGIIEFLGRMDDQVKVRGFRVELGEINESMKEYEGIKDAFTIVVDDSSGEKQIVSYYVCMPNCQVDSSGIRNCLRNKLPHYMVPTTFVEIDKIPLNANGKVNRYELPIPDMNSICQESEFIAPETDEEKGLATVWSDVLGIEAIGINDNFFAIGGDSFKAVQVISKFHGKLSIMDIFKYSTIKELANLLTQERSDERELIYQISSGSDSKNKTAVVCIPFAGGSAIAYKELAMALSENITLYAVQIPGHDFSQKDEKLESLENVARMCVAEIKQKVVAKKIAVYGHCLGGALAIEIARVLVEEGFSLVGVFMGGNFPVSELPGKFFKVWNQLFPRDRRMSNRAYMDMLRSLGGFNENLSDEQRDFIIASLRHDRRESERYYRKQYSDNSFTKLDVPLLCVVGELDRTTEFYLEQYHDWEFFCREVDTIVIPQAGHYFFKHQANTLSEIIEEQLNKWESEPEKEVMKSADETTQIEHPTKKKKEVVPSLNLLLAFILGQFVSLVGSQLSSFAMGIWVYGITGSAMSFGATLIFSRLPGIFMLPISGVLADRYSRRIILICSNVCSATVTLVLAFLVYSNKLQIYHIYLAVSIKSFASAFQRPAYLAAVAQITPKRYLGQANGFVQLSNSIGEMLAPVLGGFLIAVWNLSGIIFLDFISYAICIVTLLSIRFPSTMFRRNDESFFTQMASGWNFICRRKSYIALVIYFVVFNLLVGIVSVLVTPLVLSFASSVKLGLISAATGLGGLLGGVLMSMWGGTKRRSEGMIGFGITMGLAYVLIGLRADIRLVVIGVFAYGVSMSLMNAHWQTLIQSKVRHELLARVFSINQMFVLWAIPLGYYLGGILSDKFFKPLLSTQNQISNNIAWLVGTGPERGIGLLFVMVGLLIAIWGTIGMKYKPLRYMDDLLPDAVVGPIFISNRDELQKEEDRRLETNSLL